MIFFAVNNKKKWEKMRNDSRNHDLARNNVKFIENQLKKKLFSVAFETREGKENEKFPWQARSRNIIDLKLIKVPLMLNESRSSLSAAYA